LDIHSGGLSMLDCAEKAWAWRPSRGTVLEAVIESEHLMSTRLILTYDDYVALPGDGLRHEIHDGSLSVTPAPSPRHQKVIVNVLGFLDEHVKMHRIGEGEVMSHPST